MRHERWRASSLSREAYWREHKAFGSSLFRAGVSTPRGGDKKHVDFEGAVAAFPPEGSDATREMKGFMEFMWTNCARFVDIAAERTRRLRGTERDLALSVIVTSAWAKAKMYDVLTQSPTQWFRQIVEEAMA